MGHYKKTTGDVEGFRTGDDVPYGSPEHEGSTYAKVHEAVFENPYQLVWGASDARPLPRYQASLTSLLKAQFLNASNRTIQSGADLRWGRKRRGFRRLLHPNGIIATGVWEIDESNPYSGYFQKTSRGLIIARISTNSTAVARGENKAFSLTGKLFPTEKEKDANKYQTANFFTQDDFGGTRALRLSDTELRNAPHTTAWNRGMELPILLRTGMVLGRADKMPTERQLYQIAELGQTVDDETRVPEFMRLRVSPGHLVVDEHDFRDEVMAHIFDRGDPEPRRTLSFDISVSDAGERVGHVLLPRGERVEITNWQRIGTITFNNAVASYNGDFVLHFNHPAWRDDRNRPETISRR